MAGPEAAPKRRKRAPAGSGSAGSEPVKLGPVDVPSAKAASALPPPASLQPDAAEGAGRIHLVKLCVGVTTIAELEAWIAERQATAEQAGVEFVQRHVTRSTPTRSAALLDGGSLYWVIAGQIAARQRLAGIDPHVRDDGTPACALRLDPQVIRVEPRPFRPFQGWRYLADAPPDLSASAGADLPAELSRELRSLGLL